MAAAVIYAGIVCGGNDQIAGAADHKDCVSEAHTIIILFRLPGYPDGVSADVLSRFAAEGVLNLDPLLQVAVQDAGHVCSQGGIFRTEGLAAVHGRHGYRPADDCEAAVCDGGDVVRVCGANLVGDAAGVGALRRSLCPALSAVCAVFEKGVSVIRIGSGYGSADKGSAVINFFEADCFKIHGSRVNAQCAVHEAHQVVALFILTAGSDAVFSGCLAGFTAQRIQNL